MGRNIGDWALVYQHRGVLKIAGQEHPDRHRPTAGIKQWMAPAVDTQLNQLFHTQFHHVHHPLKEYNLPTVSTTFVVIRAKMRNENNCVVISFYCMKSKTVIYIDGVDQAAVPKIRRQQSF